MMKRVDDPESWKIARQSALQSRKPRLLDRELLSRPKTGVSHLIMVLPMSSCRSAARVVSDFVCSLLRVLRCGTLSFDPFGRPRLDFTSPTSVPLTEILGTSEAS